jgi:lysophospholipase L1-like esterase
MKQILVYADSLSWGIIPGTRQRLPFARRWPGVLETGLNEQGEDVRVIENCLNGRRTVWEDPLKPGRDGSQGLAQVIEMHSPLALVILMLGINDFQRSHNNNAWLSAQGTAKLISIIRQAPIEPGMPVPDILVAAPPAITAPVNDMKEKFEDAGKRFAGLAEELKKVCLENNTHFFDAAAVIKTSTKDGIHLDTEQHAELGRALSKTVAAIIK